MTARQSTEQAVNGSAVNPNSGGTNVRPSDSFFDGGHGGPDKSRH
jgi:hypothetical protein